jgi:hypothetical protein
LAGCGITILEKSPAEVVKSAYTAGNQGRYSEAESYLSTEAEAAVKSQLGAMGGGVKGVWDHNTRNGTIDRIEILSEEVRGEGATVHFRLHFKDGNTKEDGEPLIKEKGHWKITIGNVPPLAAAQPGAPSPPGSQIPALDLRSDPQPLLGEWRNIDTSDRATFTTLDLVLVKETGKLSVSVWQRTCCIDGAPTETAWPWTNDVSLSAGAVTANWDSAPGIAHGIKLFLLPQPDGRVRVTNSVSYPEGFFVKVGSEEEANKNVGEGNRRLQR